MTACKKRGFLLISFDLFLAFQGSTCLFHQLHCRPLALFLLSPMAHFGVQGRRAARVNNVQDTRTHGRLAQTRNNLKEVVFPPVSILVMSYTRPLDISLNAGAPHCCGHGANLISIDRGLAGRSIRVINRRRFLGIGETRCPAWAPAPRIPQERHVAHLSGGGPRNGRSGKQSTGSFNGAIIHHRGKRK